MKKVVSRCQSECGCEYLREDILTETHTHTRARKYFQKILPTISDIHSIIKTKRYYRKMRHQILGVVSGAEFSSLKKILEKMGFFDICVKSTRNSAVFSKFDPHNLVYKQNAFGIRNQHHKLSRIARLLVKTKFSS